MPTDDTDDTLAPYLLPARLLCHAIADTLQGRAVRLASFDHRTKDATRRGRTQQAEQCRRQAHAVATFGASLPHGACIDATLAGLLVALAAGESALAMIEDRLLEMGQDARCEALDAVSGIDLPAIVRVVMGEG